MNSPKWRDHLRASLGFCREHAWLAGDKRLGDALGFSIIYRDILNTVVNQLNDDHRSVISPRNRSSLPGQIPEQARQTIEKVLSVFTPRKRCPVCEHRDETSGNTVSMLVEGLETPEMVHALQDSDGLCLPHLRLALEHVRNTPVCETLLGIHREKLEVLRAELDEFIRKNEYQFAAEGPGKEGDAWRRAVSLLIKSSKEGMRNIERRGEVPAGIKNRCVWNDHTAISYDVKFLI